MRRDDVGMRRDDVKRAGFVRDPTQQDARSIDDHRSRRRLDAARGPGRPNGRVGTIPGEQLVVGAQFDQTAVAQHGDRVGTLGLAEPVRHDQGGSAPNGDQGCSFEVAGRCTARLGGGLVENHHRGPGQPQPGQRQVLACATVSWCPPSPTTVAGPAAGRAPTRAPPPLAMPIQESPRRRPAGPGSGCRRQFRRTRAPLG